MEKTCEFCGSPRPVVYCHADAAYLCLSCDAKVHSANALSGRHSRDLLCDSCRESIAFVRCVDHSMLLCRGCESHLHGVFSAHKKVMVRSFIGCPKAQQFASLWGLNVRDQSQFLTHGDQMGSESCVSIDHYSMKGKNSSSAQPQMGRSRKQHKIQNNHQQEQNKRIIVQQILDLRKLQLTEGDKQSPPTSSKSQKDDEGNTQLKELDSLASDIQSFNNSSQALETENFTSPMSQLDHISCSSVGGDPYWQCKSPQDNSQFWSQNLQDLGTCEDLGRFDDFDIPDVDLSFRNLEDLFTKDIGVTDPLLEDHDLKWSDLVKEASLDESGIDFMKTTEGVLATSSISFNNYISSKDQEHKSDQIAHLTSRKMDYSTHVLRSAASFSHSLLSGESNGSDCLDSRHSVNLTEAEFGESSKKISQDAKQSRVHGKRSQLVTGSSTRKKIKGRFVNVGGHESETVDVTKSY